MLQIFRTFHCLNERGPNDQNRTSTCVRALIGRHMASLATRTKPIATSSTLILCDASLFGRLSPSGCDWLRVERKWLISSVSCWNWLAVSSTERGSFSPGPKIWGKNEGSRRPRAKLASVTVRGPPVGQKRIYYLKLLQTKRNMI